MTAPRSAELSAESPSAASCLYCRHAPKPEQPVVLRFEAVAELAPSRG